MVVTLGRGSWIGAVFPRVSWFKSARPLVRYPTERPSSGLYPVVNGQAFEAVRDKVAFRPDGASVL